MKLRLNAELMTSSVAANEESDLRKWEKAYTVQTVAVTGRHKTVVVVNHTIPTVIWGGLNPLDVAFCSFSPSVPIRILHFSQ